MDTVLLNNGVEIPCIGNGPGILGYTSHVPLSSNLLGKIYNKFYQELVLKPKYIHAVTHAFQIGFTLLDYSAAYGDGRMIGAAIKKSGVPRSQLFLTTRVSNKDQMSRTIKASLINQLKNFGTDYIDLLMFHWPVTDIYLETWEEMVKLYQQGYCRAIGVANCHQHHLDRLMKSSTVIPMVNQVEVHPLFSQKKLIDYCKEHQIVVEGYTAIARFDDRLMRLPLLTRIAKKYQKTIVQIILRWHIQTGVIPIVRSLNCKRQLENLAVFDFNLTQEEMAEINGININSRLRYDPDNCDFSIL